jgi:hypothetical protein
MYVNFCITGRLGNAIFRYMASAIICINFNGKYVVDMNQQINCSEGLFLSISKKLINNEIPALRLPGINMSRFYQHEIIYTINKNKIKEFILNNPDHFVLTDGITAGDKRREKFYMLDILKTPIYFNKKYKTVLHIRLEDFVNNNNYIREDRIINLLNKIIINSLCIVCKKPETNFEKLYIKKIKDYMDNKNIEVIIESNDTLTDYYIMKEAEILICSNSTLSWCAAFFSDSLKKCYFPDYKLTINSTFKNPITDTELY